ncbi:MAG: hypothetical protein JRH07_01835 [Deltaproteobacteria bacterium]|nr:hypothetical protein [Deltaproteobacteria bacterium]MBW2120572.1 hypothetical protein [Deltaproteobacteria bacterium]
MSKKRFFPHALAILLLLLCFCGSGMAGDDQPKRENWAVTLYVTKLNSGTLKDTFLLQAEYLDSYLVDAALSRRIYTYKRYLDFEVEANVAKHFGEQHQWELNGLITVRWLLFPWNKYLNTTVAIGQGLSYATEIPDLEAQLHEETSQLLVFSMYELTLALPKLPRWVLVTRIHHRSGFAGFFGGVHGASNSVGIGLRYRF